MNWIPHDVNSEVVYKHRERYQNCNNYFKDSSGFYLPTFKAINHNYTFKKPNGKEKILSEQKKTDKDYIDKFTLNKQKNASVKASQTLKIFEAKQLLVDIISLKKKLEKDAHNINVNDKNFDSLWESIEEQKKHLNEKIIKLQANVDPLKIKISKILKAKQWRRRKKLQLMALKEEKKKEIEKKHKIIDKLLNERNDEVEAVKREAALKRQADTVLHEVRRKKYEGTKMLNMLSTLKKLRELRIKEEEKKGGYCSKQLTDVFNEVINRFQILWEKQIDVYKLEEKGLKIMLEENSLPLIKESKFETNLLQWEKALFGDISNEKDNELITCADYNIDALIQVRRDWDQFLTSEPTAVSSSIPPGWVLPPETENTDWKKFLIKSNKTNEE